MKHLLIALLSILPAFTFAADKAKHVDAEGAAKLIAEGKVTIVDVRTQEEFSEGHLKDARNIDISEPTFEAELAKLDKTQPVLVHCLVSVSPSPRRKRRGASLPTALQNAAAPHLILPCSACLF
jgi:glutamate/tyrosine decarboxylase-like PLP-dependent enzyme